MPMVISKNALPAAGALYLTISFRTVEVKRDRPFINEGHTVFVPNVRKDRKKLTNNAIYNAIKQEFPNRTVTAYDINILEYHYTYYLNDYEVIERDGKYYETYIDIDTKKRKLFVENKYEIKSTHLDKYVGNDEVKN